VVGLAACASSSKTKSGSTKPSPGVKFSTANVKGLGTVVVDARGYTVYLLTADGQKSLPCDDASGCTGVWPDLPLPAGTSPQAGGGVQTSLLSKIKLANGEDYPTYKGWGMYEYSGDTGPGQAHGQGIQSFGGTWYAIDANGAPVMASAASTSSTSKSPYGY
jgi:predicted lipoprotein with Yx(FWY)xxD motif